MSGPSTRPPALRADRVSVRYGIGRGVTDLSLAADAGEFLALAGPNGSGKTTFLRAVLGLVPLVGGHIALFGRNARELTLRERARSLAWLPQDETPQDNVRLIDYVLYGRYAHLPPFGSEGPEDRARARESLTEVDLWEQRHRGVRELSGGERQRVLLARALAQDTPILLLDEPTAHLDIGHQLELLERVRRLCHDRGRLVVAALHDLNLAARFADRVAVLSRGRMVEQGRPAEVLSPSLLREVWDVQAELRWDPRTRQPFLIPVLAPHPPPAVPSPSRRPGPIHVVGGGGSATTLLRRLVEERFRVSAGTLHLFDTDAETAQELGVATVLEVPFAPIGEETRLRTRAMLRDARAIVLAPVAVGPGNMANLEDVLAAAESRPVYVWEPPSETLRDFTGGAAQRLVEQICARAAARVSSLDALMVALRNTTGTDRSVGSPTASATAGPAAAT
jgi:iron complex transport system ATP-binding protein